MPLTGNATPSLPPVSMTIHSRGPLPTVAPTLALADIGVQTHVGRWHVISENRSAGFERDNLAGQSRHYTGRSSAASTAGGMLSLRIYSLAVTTGASYNSRTENNSLLNA